MRPVLPIPGHGEGNDDGRRAMAARHQARAVHWAVPLLHRAAFHVMWGISWALGAATRRAELSTRHRAAHSGTALPAGRWHSSVRRPRLWSQVPGRPGAPLSSAPQLQLGRLWRAQPPAALPRPRRAVQPHPHPLGTEAAQDHGLRGGPSPSIGLSFASVPSDDVPHSHRGLSPGPS